MHKADVLLSNAMKAFDIVKIGTVRVTLWDNPDWKNLLEGHRPEVEIIWQREMERQKGHLFNGTLLNFVGSEVTEHGIHLFAHFIEYKYYLAKRVSRSLPFDIRPLGVSGITVVEDCSKEKILFAKRSSLVFQYPGFWELVPSGAIDSPGLEGGTTIDYKKMILEEFSEETGLPSGCVQDCCGFAVIYDRNERTFDVGCSLRIRTDSASGLLPLPASEEYHDFKLVALAEISRFIYENEERMVPTSLGLLGCWLRFGKTNNRSNDLSLH